MRIACHGWVLRDGGSVAGAGWHLLDELARRGHEIDFFAQSDHVGDPQLPADRVTVVPVDFRAPAWVTSAGRLPSVLGKGARIASSQAYERRSQRGLGRLAAERHRARPYDVSLHLGIGPWFAVPGRPALAWPQGAPGLELEALVRNRRRIVRVSGLEAYLTAVGYYRVKDRTAWRWLRRPAVHVLTGSQVAGARHIRAGAAGRTTVLPYPVAPAGDLGARHLEPSARLRFLVLGRFDARKRVELAIAATCELRRRGIDASLDIAGRDGSLAGWAAWLGRLAGEHVHLHGQVPFAEAQTLLRRSTALVQPSENEEFGHAVGEALWHGVPVVVGPGNGTGEYLEPGTGVVFAAHEPAAVADAMLEAAALAGDPQTAGRCRALALGAFAPARVADIVEARLAALASDPALVG